MDATDFFAPYRDRTNRFLTTWGHVVQADHLPPAALEWLLDTVGEDGFDIGSAYVPQPGKPLREHLLRVVGFNDEIAAATFKLFWC